MSSFVVREAALADLPPAVLYALLRLRVDVFVVEQECAYPELDGRDLEPDCVHVWAESGGVPVAALRVLRDPDGRGRIGRVATAPASRGAGVAGTLVRRALELLDGDEVVLDAQAHLVDWYARFGFVAQGEEFLEDRIPHRTMVRPADVVGSSTGG
ncbi:GNAT family N-acetyltransferase [Kineococcus rhizosphaerae]|uniref:ElaA protein n=1 Tax=Kineococcus rhizosphaerae TaxID=559628 RepID=A0A2T0R6E2_9ACTN|nr:GNAT family N-acetyltransferase [Kineococcus rhizosphaerae]PRY16718.1 ElaA protein [Kineococcus rhizosphaerae]